MSNLTAQQYAEITLVIDLANEVAKKQALFHYWELAGNPDAAKLRELGLIRERACLPS